ncbi:MAG TPA: hypothetical protein VF173_34640 [Thermoanaerobaculia bacterium]|nr:hypothetical protein [Thermoanaerobaculia bacterium]
MHHAVMAIGASPENPPEWAIEACRAYHFQRQIEVESTGGGRPPKDSVEDGLLLDEVATLIVEDNLSLTAAVRKITGEDSEGTAFRRLMRTWKRHLKTPPLTVLGNKLEKTNKWLEAARQRHHDRYNQECFDQALAEIKAGDLNVEIDPSEEAERLRLAKWITFQSTTDPKQSAQIKIAPTSRERHVIAIKRLLLERMKKRDDKSS